MNPVLILTRNCLELTKRCVESLRNQDVPVKIHIYDNESSDGTKNWLNEIWHDDDTDIIDQSSGVDLGVSAGWNFCLDNIFLTGDQWDVGWKADHVLVVNNDTYLPPWFYSSLLSYDVPFVTGVSCDSMDGIRAPEPRKELRECPDFSAFLIRRDCWEKVGRFDESMVHYASDMDYHIRAHRLGVPLMNAGVNFYHERSSTIKKSSPQERRAIEAQADRDRAAFRTKYGFGANDPQYEEVFKEPLVG